MQLEVWDEMQALERRFDDLFRTFVGPRGRYFVAPELASGFHAPFVPATDVFARNGDMVVSMELPGIDPEKEVTLTLDEGELVVKGSRERHEKIEEDKYLRVETSYGAFERHIAVPKEVSDKDIEAKYHDGVLEIQIHGASKAPAVREPKAIAIAKG
jgi:HSP20 family protein